MARQLFDGSFASFMTVKTNKDYRAWAVRLAKRLRRDWEKALEAELDFPRSLKLVNLVAKALCTVSPVWPTSSKAIARCIDVPLDQYSLRPLACIEGLGYLRRASMGSVQDEAEYDTIQQAIRGLCKKAGSVPIAYDFLAWDGTHPRKV